jgi:hypothetical protein
LLGEQDFAASSHDSFDANSLVMVTLRQATRLQPCPGGMYRGQLFKDDLVKCHKQKEIMDLSDLATGPNRNQLSGDLVNSSNQVSMSGLRSQRSMKAGFTPIACLR